jgi:replicative DNA helicase
MAELTGTIASAANAGYHALLLKEKYLRRRMIQICNEHLADSYRDEVDVFVTYDKMLTALDQLNTELNRLAQKPFSQVVDERVQQIKNAGATKTYITGLNTCIRPLDHALQGLQPQDLIIIAARPGMGKTALAIDMARKQSGRLQIPVGVFSLEMSATALADRMLSSETRVPLKVVRTGGLTHSQWQHFDAVMPHVRSLPVLICDKGGLSINDICAIAKNWKLRYNIGVLYIDYLQLITVTAPGTRFGSREQEVSHISRRLKALAKDLNIPVVALAQLSRSCEARADKRPMLSDLRESGSIEQDADIVLFPFRPVYYNENHSEPDQVQIVIGKFRNGETGEVECRFDREIQVFKDA